MGKKPRLGKKTKDVQEEALVSAERSLRLDRKLQDGQAVRSSRVCRKPEDGIGASRWADRSPRLGIKTRGRIKPEVRHKGAYVGSVYYHFAYYFFL